jgi:RNA polymerase-binding transcription factor DksA
MNSRLEFLKRMEDALEQKRAALVHKISSEKDGAVREKQVSDVGDEAQTIAMERLESSLQMTDIDELRLIERALDFLRRGEYGVCVDCGEDISQKRLENHPYAARCIGCQEAFEG